MHAAVTDICGPVFAKEAVEVARKKRFYVNRCLYGLALLVILLIFADEYGGQLHGKDAQARRRMANAASELFIAVNGLQFAAVFFVVPIFTSAVIAGEREANTLELLFTTTLNDRQIVLGKLVSRLMALAILVLSGLPILSLTLFFGGVDPNAIWRMAAVTLLATLLVGAHAIYFSTVTRSPLAALVRTYWWLGIELVAAPAAIAFVVFSLPNSIQPMKQFVAAVLALTNPIVLFGLILDESAMAWVNSVAGDWVFPAGFVLPSAWSALLIRKAIRNLRKDPVPVKLFSRIRALARWPISFLPKRKRNKPHRTMSELTNPLWTRARQSRAYDREGHIARIQTGGWLVATTFFVLTLIFEPRALRDEEVSIAFGSCAWGGIALLAMVIAGASLSGDRKRGFFELVLVTPLSGREVIDGTMLAVWEHFRRIAWLPFALAIAFSLTGASYAHGAVASVITGSLFIALAMLYGIGCSLSARSVTAGLACAFAFPLVVNIGTAALIGVFEDVHAPILWLLALGLFFVGRRWTRRRDGCGAVFCYLLGMHLVLVGLATAWTTDFRRDQYPAAAMNSAFMTVVMLDDNYSREFRPHSAFAILFCYWTALVVNFILARRWLIRHFDRLAGRCGESNPSDYYLDRSAESYAARPMPVIPKITNGNEMMT